MHCKSSSGLVNSLQTSGSTLTLILLHSSISIHPAGPFLQYLPSVAFNFEHYCSFVISKAFFASLHDFISSGLIATHFLPSEPTTSQKQSIRVSSSLNA